MERSSDFQENSSLMKSSNRTHKFLSKNYVNRCEKLDLRKPHITGAREHSNTSHYSLAPKVGTKRPLEPPYEGPFPIIDRVSDYVFNVLYHGQPTTISTERLKPAFIETTADDQNATRMFDTPKTYPGPSQKRKEVRFAA